MPQRAHPLSARHRAALGFLALMLAAPFLQPFHYQPISTFYSEVCAAVLGLAAAACLLLEKAVWRAFPVPRVTAVAALLILALGAQWAAGRIVFPQAALLQALYLLWAALLACLGALLARDVGLERLLRALAWATLVGAVATALMVFVQRQGLAAPVWLVVPVPGPPSGNLGQRNHAAEYLWWGIAAALYLHHRRWLPLLGLVPAVALLVGAAVVTGSRGPAAYGVVLILLAATVWRQGASPYRALAIAAIALLAQLGGSEAMKALGDANAGGMDRFAPAALTGDGRWAIWRTAWELFLQHPWLGNGVGNYAWGSVQVAGLAPASLAVRPAEHAHNLVLQWLADYGLVVTVMALGLLAWWGLHALRRGWGAERGWAVGVLVMVVIHSLAEYPLWFTYFLGPAVLLLGALEERTPVVSLVRGRMMFVLFAVLAIVTLANLVHDHRLVEKSHYWPYRRDVAPAEAWTDAVESLREVSRGSLLAPYAEAGFAVAMTIDRDRAPEQLALCRPAMQFRAGADLMAKCAALEWLAGHRQEARELAAVSRRAELRVNPDARETDQILSRLAATFPELAELLPAKGQ